MALTLAQIESLWIQNGGNPSYAPTAAAIAMAESSGNAYDTTGDAGTSWGLYQIHWTVHPEFNTAQLLDPNYNTQAAIALSGGTQSSPNFTPWTTYKNGAYRANLAAANAAYAGVSGTSPTQANTTPVTIGGSTTAASVNDPAPSSTQSPNAISSILGALFFGNPNENPQQVTTNFVGIGIAIVAFLIGGIWLAVGSLGNSSPNISVQPGPIGKVGNELEEGAAVAA